MAGEKAHKESFAIPDDEIDIRLIQQQIASALGKATPNASKSSDAKPTGPAKKDDAPPPLIKPEQKSKQKEEEKTETKPLPPTIDLFGNSGIKSPLSPTPPEDDEPDIVEIEHSIPMEKITPEAVQMPTINIPKDETPTINTLEHSIPMEKLTPGIELEHTIKIPQDDETPVNTLEHSIPMEKLTPGVQLEHSVQIPFDTEPPVNTLEHSIPTEEVQGPQLEHSKPQQATINNLAQAEHSIKKPERVLPKAPHSVKSAPQQPIKPTKSNKSKEDSMDINELVMNIDGDISLDLLNQLTNKINSEMGYEETPPELPHSTPEEVEENQTVELGHSAPTYNEEKSVELPHSSSIKEELERLAHSTSEYIDEEENSINTVAAQEEQMVEDIINQENEKTVVTEQICEYPVSTMDSEYIQALDYLDGDKRYKKYVIYIDEINQEFLDSLSIQERKDIINSILREQDDARKARIAEERRRKLIAHLMLAVISIFVLTPLLFLLVNKCMEATIQNYRRSQNNWEVLYKERGKIKAPKPQY